MVEPDQDVRDDKVTLGETGALLWEGHGRFQARGVVIGEIPDDRLSARLCLREIAEVRAAADQ
jgi:hypothetical protein